jgi:Fe-S cluster biogenesis protein NfuA
MAEKYMKEKVQKIIEELRPGIQMDGGDLELVEVTDEGIVKVRLHGACAHCPMSSITLKHYVERRIQKDIPEIKSVEAV